MSPTGDDWKETGISDRTLPHRVDHLFTFERVRSVSPDLRERAQVRIAGDRAVSVTHTVVAPASADRDRRRRDAPRDALNAVGSILFGGAVLGAFTVFVLRLRDGTARLARAALWSGTVFALGLAASLLRTSDTFDAWDSLTPRAIALLQHVVTLVQENVWTFAVLVAVAAAGDALDRDSGTNRGGTLWQLTRGHLWNPFVGASSARGFLIGCICGGFMAAFVLLLTQFAGAHVSLQPPRLFLFRAQFAAARAFDTAVFFAGRPFGGVGIPLLRRGMAAPLHTPPLAGYLPARAGLWLDPHVADLLAPGGAVLGAGRGNDADWLFVGLGIPALRRPHRGNVASDRRFVYLQLAAFGKRKPGTDDAGSTDDCDFLYSRHWDCWGLSGDQKPPHKRSTPNLHSLPNLFRQTMACRYAFAARRRWRSAKPPKKGIPPVSRRAIESGSGAAAD